MRQFIRLLMYGYQLDFHLRKRNKYDFTKHRTVLQYHYEKAQYYYEKIYGKSPDENQIKS